MVMSDLIMSELLLFLDPPPSAQGRLSAAPTRKKSEKMQAHIQKIASRVHLDVRLASFVFCFISPDPPLRPTVRSNMFENQLFIYLKGPTKIADCTLKIAQNASPPSSSASFRPTPRSAQRLTPTPKP